LCGGRREGWDAGRSILGIPPASGSRPACRPRCRGAAAPGCGHKSTGVFRRRRRKVLTLPRAHLRGLSAPYLYSNNKI